jgi:transcriptional regulator of nitric oxide reductase
MSQSRSNRDRRALVAATLLALAGIAACVEGAAAEVFHSRESALALAFGEGARIEAREIFLAKEEQARATELAGSEIPSRLVRVYEGHRGDELLGYAYFETHRVRSLPETLMVVVDPTGGILGVHLLAFHEPEAYLPHPGFLGQFLRERLDGELSLRTGIQGMAGSTFTARAVTAAVRRVLAIHEVAVRPRLASASPSEPEVD